MDKATKKVFIPLGVILIITAIVLPSLINCNGLLQMSSQDQKNYLLNNPGYHNMTEANQDCNNAEPSYQMGLGIVGFVCILLVFIFPLVFPKMEEPKK